MKTYCRLTLPALCAAACLLLGCVQTAAPSKMPNQLSRSEQRDGWKLLFNGETLAGWRCYGKNEPPRPGWFVEDNCLKLKAQSNAGDIITEQQFENFELQWDWRIPPKANNGIKYLVTERRQNSPGPEYQMVDDSTMENPKHRTATLYDILPAREDKVLLRPGEWNRSRIIVNGKHVEHWLNGKKTVEYELESEALKAAVAQSKFRNVPDFHKKIKGHILLTYHQDECWFRNIKIRELE